MTRENYYFQRQFRETLMLILGAILGFGVGAFLVLAAY